MFVLILESCTSIQEYITLKSELDNQFSNLKNGVKACQMLMQTADALKNQPQNPGNAQRTTHCGLVNSIF